MIKNESHIQHILKSIRTLQQQGDYEKAKLEFETTLREPVISDPAAKSLYGVLLLLNHDVAKGTEYIKEASSHLPDDSNAASDLGFGWLLLGNIDEAIKYLERAILLPGPEATAFNRLGAACLAKGDLKASSDAFQEALLRDPERAEIHNNLGGIKIRQGKLLSALAHYERALEINKDLPQSQNGRMAILVELERADELILEINTRIDDTSNETETLVDRQYIAGILEATGRFQEAFRHLEKALTIDPENMSVLMQLGTLFFEHFKYHLALKIFQKACDIEPTNLFALSSFARCLSEMEKHGQAEEAAEKLFEIDPDAPLSYLTRAAILSAAEKYEAASKDIQIVIEALPGSAEAWSLLGHNHMHTGDIDYAVTCFKKASELNPSALSQLIEARIFPEDPKAIDKLASLSKNPLIHREPRVAMLFSLSKYFEKKKSFNKAFEFADRGNYLVRRSQLYTFERYRLLIEQIKNVFSNTLMERFRGKGSSSQKPVFIVGMPRSGTTLVEQILSSHPDVFGAGELGHIPAITALMPKVIKTSSPFPMCMNALKGWMVSHAAKYYLNKIYEIAHRATKVTDKLPQNFLYLGLISVIFPNAAIIHVKRNLKDIALSNYFTNFKYKNGILGYSFSLEDTGHMLNSYREIMSHYKNNLCLSFFELDYETLVEHPEEQARNLLEYVGLKWDDRVLAFHQTERIVKTASLWQVRQPLYTTSKERWKNYKDHLGPLEKILNEYRGE